MNEIKIKSSQKGNSIYNSDLNDLYQRAILAMRYKPSNWVYGFNYPVAKESPGDADCIPFFTKTKRIMLLFARLGTTNEDVVADPLPLFKIKVRRPNQTIYLTLTQTNGVGSKNISNTTYTNSAGTIVAGERLDFFYSYVVADFTPNETGGGSTIVDADGVPIDNRIVIQITDNSNNIVNTLPRNTLVRVIDIGSGVENDYKTSFFDGQTIPKEMIFGINDVLKWQMKGYEHTTKYENYQNLILFRPSFTTSPETFPVIENIYDLLFDSRFTKWLNKTYQNIDYNFSTLKIINVTNYGVTPASFYSNTTGNVIDKRIEFQNVSNERKLKLKGRVINDGFDYIWNEGKVHRVDANQAFDKSISGRALSRQSFDLLTQYSFSSSLLFQHNFIDYDTDSSNNNTTDESWLIFNYLGNLSWNPTIDYKRPINNFLLSYICNLLSQPFFELSGDEFYSHSRIYDNSGIVSHELKEQTFFRTEFYDLPDALADISIENFNSDTNHNIYIRFFV